MANTDIQTLTQEQVKTSFTLPSDLHKAVRIAAIERGMDAQDLYVAAVKKYLGLDKPKRSVA